MLIWLDVETTGLDPEKDALLEIAAVQTDWNLTQVGEPFEAVLRFDGPVSEFIADMHGSNGLLETCEFHGVTLERCCSDLMSWLGKIEGKRILAGASVHFDRAFLKKNMPEAEEMFYHRHFDVSTLRQAFGEWANVESWPTDDRHRAMSDVRTSIQQAVICQQLLMRAT